MTPTIRERLRERWTRHEPMTPFEMFGAVARDADYDDPTADGNACIYDRRGLLNVVAVLLDELDTLERRVRAAEGALEDGALPAMKYAARVLRAKGWTGLADNLEADHAKITTRLSEARSLISGTKEPTDG